MLVAQPIPRCGYIFQQLRLYHLEAVVAERLFQTGTSTSCAWQHITSRRSCTDVLMGLHLCRPCARLVVLTSEV